MAITGINNSSCTSYYASNYKNTVKKTDSEKDSTNTKDGNVTTSTVELKTSRPGVTKTEQIKTGYSLSLIHIFTIKVLKVVERIARNKVEKTVLGRTAECSAIYHQPKRPKKRGN